MLEHIRIQNVGIVKDLEIDFDKEITMFTGETGAGKSMLLSSILLLLGERASATTIRQGAKQAIISSVWDIAGLNEVLTWLDVHGIACENNELLVRRIVKDNGRSQCFVQGQSLTQKELSECMTLLCEIHTQYEHQSLFRSGAQLRIIDRYAGLTIRVSEFSMRLQQYKKREKTYYQSIQDEQSRLRELDYLNFAVQEIQQAHIKKSEDEAILEELRSASNLEKIMLLWQRIDMVFNDESGVLSSLKETYASIESLSELQPSIEPLYDRFNTMILELDDLSNELRSERDKINGIDANSIDQLESRLSVLEGLKKKYGNSLEKVVEFMQEAQDKIVLLEDFVENKDELEKQLAAERLKLKGEALELSEIRVKAASGFSNEVNDILHKLAMEKAIFSVKCSRRQDVKSFFGLDEVEFYMVSNVGELAQPLMKIVSGGELSRVMLAIKVISSKNESLQTLVLDEVDSGIGGNTATVLAQYLHMLGRNTQVLCVTHLPIIAACAHRHYKVQKKEEDNRTIVEILFLSRDERVQELARMMVGNAEDQLAQSQAENMIATYF